jgi:hypothetical protein
MRSLVNLLVIIDALPRQVNEWVLLAALNAKGMEILN